MAKWLETTCNNCGDSVHYLEEWGRVPDLCKGCIADKRAERAKWHEKACGCGNSIKYHEDWDRKPDLCKDCIAEKRAERAKWHTKNCSCGSVIKYHEDWSRIPDLCKECNRWLEKECKAQGCTCVIRYKAYWDNVPEYCKECQKWLTKPCAACDCSNEIRYKQYWERVPEYCRECKGGQRRITHCQVKDDGTVHEYSGWGYVNKQGVAVFKDDTASGKHSHEVQRSDGTRKGVREEGHDQDWVNEPVDVSFRGESRDERERGVRKTNRYTTMYKDRRTDHHVHDFSRRDYSELPGPVPHTVIKPSEGSAGEYYTRKDKQDK